MSEDKKAHGTMLLFAFLVSTSFTVGRAITFSLEPAALTFVRFLMASGIFAIVALSSKARLQLPTPSDAARYFFLAFLLVVFFVTMFEGLRWSTPLRIGAVFTLVPFMTAILVLMLFGQRLSTTITLGLFVAGCASLWIMFGGDLHAITSLRLGKGELIFLIGCLFYAAYTPFVQKLHTGGSLIPLTLGTLVAGVFWLLLYGWHDITTTDWRKVPAATYLGIAWLALFTTAISFYLVQYAALRLPSVKVMSYTLLIPAFVLLQRLVLGGPWPGASTLMALAILIAAMLVLQRA